ncbi:MAG TPA: ATP-binding protein, partial [Methanocorpusculum sp.]|nr:ATP-binding protein [Methanocorpusculum sp.]
NYVLTWTGDDPATSLSLSEKLAEQGITIPDFIMPETTDGLTEYAAAVDAAVREKGWEYCPEMVLDLFSFRKFVMFKDLDPKSWDENFSPETHPLIAGLFHPETSPDAEAGETFPENEIDLRLPSEKSYNIMDADSSQVAAIEEAKSGKNLVVEGPPGTGKSQTIANMIAEMLVSGKTVLFVSEKMAALEVVKRRLDTAGLSRFCLELHSQKAKKGEIIRELEQSIQHPESTTASPDRIHLQIDSLRGELDGYCSELVAPIGACAFTPYDLFGIREQYRYEFEDSPAGPGHRIPRVIIPSAKEITPDQYRDAIAVVQDIEALLPSLMPTGRSLTQHPWAGCVPGLVLPQDRDEILELVENYRISIETLLSAMRRLSDLTGVPVPCEETGISRMIEACRLLTSDFAAYAGALSNPLWDKETEVARLITGMQKLFDHRARILAFFTPEIFSHNPGGLYSVFREISRKGAIVKIFSSTYKETKAKISAYYHGAVPPDAKILTDLLDARDYLTERDAWARDKPLYASAFAPVWNGEETDPVAFARYTEWISAIRLMMKEGLATSRTLELLDAGSITKSTVVSLFAEVEAAGIAHREARAKLFARIGISKMDETTFVEQRKRCDLWSSDIDGVVLWSKLLAHTDALGKTVAAPLLEFLFADKLAPGELVPAFLTGYADSLLREAIAERPLLARFSQIPHEQKIAAFASYDRNAIAENRKRIAKILDERIPELCAGASRDSEMGVLTGEFNRKRGHMSIRMLMSKAGGLIQQIKPCFMMSPLSVAQYLDPRSVQFDVIIFDEASQVRPEDALGALMRGRQLVVMGDSHQLPPTTFFDQIAAAEDEDEGESIASITDMESLLNVCKQSYETKRLRWHYRSRHESLITVSNQEFYDGNLMVFPSPMHETPDLGLSFVHLPDTVYERGGAGVNRGEAKAVAAAVIEYYCRFPDKTLGVATFSTRQQEAIRHEVDLLLRDNPDVESLMQSESGENFFVKNLETVQGDERDTMLIRI